MPSFKPRLARLEAQRPPEPIKPPLVFTWDGEKDNAALADITARAEAEGRMLIIRRIVDPPPRKTTVMAPR